MLLRDYLKSNNIMVKQFAEMLGVKPMYLTHILNGRKGVGKKKAKEIEALTNGVVSRLEILYPEEFIEKTPSGEQLKFPPPPINKK